MIKIVNKKIPEINITDAWHFLGFSNQKIDPKLEEQTKKAVEKIKSLAVPKALLLKGDLKREDDRLYFNSIELEGEMIKEFLDGSDEAYLCCFTLGHLVDKEIRQKGLVDLEEALLLDGAASALIEKFCDEVTQEIEESEKEDGRFITERFSPGYSDLPITLQQPILDLLQAKKEIGLYVSSSSLLIPRKSVTALIGVRKKPRKPKTLRCKNCLLRGECKFGICRYSS